MNTSHSVHEAEQLLTTGELADLLRVHENSVLAYVKQGMPHIRVSPRVFRFDRSSVMAWLEKQTAAAMSAEPAHAAGE